jgi:endonuclease G
MSKRLLFIIILLVFTLLLYFFYTSKEITSNQMDNINEEIHTTSIGRSDIFYLFPKRTKSQILHYLKFSLAYNEKAEQADWVAYRLYPNSINSAVKRKNNFRKDYKIITSSASLEDYKGSGYDRGHLAPAKAMSYSVQSVSESFLMSNMSPQLPSFNRGVWKRLEKQVRDWIAISDSLYVVTGPVLNSSLPTIGVNKVSIPRAYYKTILRFYKGDINGIGFLLKHEKSSKKIADFATSIDTIEKITGLNFFYLLDSVQQRKVERNNSFNQFVKIKKD